MSKHFLFALIALLLGSLPLKSQVFINEFHYDNNGGDVNEGIELAGPAGTDLSCYKILLYNGANGLVDNVLTLTGTIPNICNGYGTRWFSSPLQNGTSTTNPPSGDGFALVLDSTLCNSSSSASPVVIQFLAYEHPFTAVNGEAIGLLADSLPIAESGSTPVGHSAQLSGIGSAYTDFNWVSGVNSINTVNPGQGFITACGPVVADRLTFASTPTGCITPGQSFSVEVCATNGSGIVDTAYTGNVTISLASGPGTLSGTTTMALSGGCATLTGLSLSQIGAYSFTATDGAFSGSSNNVYINSGCVRCPSLTGAMIDACGSDEGRNEILFFNTGDHAVPLSYPEFSLTYGSTNPPAATYSNGFASNLAYIDTLNTRAGCNIFVDAYSNSPIPPNTAFMIMRSNPNYTYDFSGWCNQSQIYVVFSTDANWVPIGNFKNCIDCDSAESGTTDRFIRGDFRSLTNGSDCDYIYDYVPCDSLMCNGNGDGLSWPYGGGGNDSAWSECTPTAPSLLPVVYGAPLAATWEGMRVRLSWATAVEVNSSHFVIERKDDDQSEFLPLATMPARINRDEPSRYDWWDHEPPSGTFFYRLRQFDQDGSSYLSRTVTLSAPAQTNQLLSVQTSQDGNWVEFGLEGEGKASVRIYSISGHMVGASSEKMLNGMDAIQLDTRQLPHGVYVYELLFGAERFGGKLLIQH